MSEHANHVLIDRQILFYEQKAPYVPSGLSILGAIEYDRRRDKLHCHECGKRFDCLWLHVQQKHGMPARDYKRKHGLNLSAALVNERIRIRASQVMKSNRAKFLCAREIHPNPPRKGYRSGPFVEKSNIRGRCSAQLLKQLHDLESKYGRTPTCRELQAHGISMPGALHTLGVPDVKSMMVLAGLRPNRPGTNLRIRPRKYSPELLVELLRNFHVNFRRFPSETDFHRGLLPSRGTWIRAFGSISNAYREAGLRFREAS